MSVQFVTSSHEQTKDRSIENARSPRTYLLDGAGRHLQQQSFYVRTKRHAGDVQKTRTCIGFTFRFGCNFASLRPRYGAQPPHQIDAVREAGVKTNVALSPLSIRLRPSIRQRSNERRMVRNSASVLIRSRWQYFRVVPTSLTAKRPASILNQKEQQPSG